MSAKQTWTQFGPRILGESDITRSEAGEIQIRDESLDGLNESFRQVQAALQSPNGLGPMMPEYSGKSAEGLAKLRQLKTGAIPALFHHEEVGDIGLMWGRPGDPKKDYLDGYGLAHIDTKHPGMADKIEEFLKHAWLESVHQDRKGALEKAILKDGVHMLVLVKKWRKRGEVTSNGNWTITAYLKEKKASKSRMQNQDATSAITRDHDIWTSLPAAAKDNTPDWKTTLSKHKGKLSLGSKGDFFPEQWLIAR